ncbi:MAG: hypothetical protein ABIV47_16175 [Roseiflexaceae bacterium]
MLQSIRAIIEPDGTIRPLEEIQVVVPTQAIITLLTDTSLAAPIPPTLPIGSVPMDRERVHEIFVAAGVTDPRPQMPLPGLLSTMERAALAARLAEGRPLSEIIIEERREGW